MANKQNILITSLITSVFLVFILLLVISYKFITKGRIDISSGKPKIAIIELLGPIYESKSIIRQFKRYGEDEDIDAILFRISSPGGGVSASQEIYEEVRKVRGPR